MKKLVFVFSVIAVLAITSFTAFAIDGDGTEETPFLITDQGELELVTDFPDCHFKLANDIVLEGTWIPLCKQTASGRFTGVFDGAGYTVSNLKKSSAEGGLFKDNTGTIKNVNVIIAEEGMTGSGAIAHYNYGTISNCTVKGNISGSSRDVGGICEYSNGTISECRFEGNISNTSSDSETGGICAVNYGIISKCAAVGNIVGKYYTGGISGYNHKTIRDCYVIGSVNSSYSYKGGIAGYNSGSTSAPAAITDCYAVHTFSGGGYGVAYKGSYSNIYTSYYDKTVSGLSSTDYGTPKSTAAMKMKQTYANDWDFETVWGINKSINDGYPYLLWEYPVVEEEAPYSVDNIKITDLSGEELSEIPDDSFYFEIDVTKNTNSKEADCLIIAVYDESNALIDVKYMKGVYYQNQTISFAALINQDAEKTGKIKTFVWNSVSGVAPLSNALEK